MAYVDTLDDSGLNPSAIRAMLLRRQAGLDPNVGTGAPNNLTPRIGVGISPYAQVRTAGEDWIDPARIRNSDSGVSPQPPKLGVEPKPPVPKLGLADQYKSLAAERPAPQQFQEHVSVPGKILGTLKTLGAGLYDFGLKDPNFTLARDVAQHAFHPQFSNAMDEYNTKLGDIGKEAKLGQVESQAQHEQAQANEANARAYGLLNPQPKLGKPVNLDREAYDDYVGQGMTPAEARKRVLQDAQDVKPDRQTHTSPFEAFAYGSPEEKKAAQAYLEFEKRMGARYRTPSEFDERYRLFQQDPETYKAMFGDKTAVKPDRATATRMLNYFNRRRSEVQRDLMLDDTQRQQQLQEIGNLERPFMDVVQPDSNGGEGRVRVISPNGLEGTVPRSQIGKAKAKGYRVAE